MRRLLEACRGQRPRDVRDAAIIVLGLRTGMLRLSICGVRIEDVQDDRLTFTKKGGSRHTILLDPATRDALAPWLYWLRQRGVVTGALFRRLGRTQLDGKVPIGERLTTDGLYRTVRFRAQKAKIKEINPYTFRATFIKLAYNCGAKPHQIAAVTGYRTDARGSTETEPATPANFLLPDWIRRPA